MCQVAKRTELTVRVADRSQSVNDVFHTATRSGASVLASCSFWDNHGAVVLLEIGRAHV